MMKPLSYLTVWSVLATLLASGGLQTPLFQSVTPEQNTTFTATREVSSLAIEPDGTLWVGTLGGILRRNPQGVWRKWTRQGGLPAHETRHIAIENGVVTATFPQAAMEWREGQWRQKQTVVSPPVSNKEQITCTAEWNGKQCIATLTEMRIKKGDEGHTVSLPKSNGTHISAFLPHGETLWAAMFGEGLWAFAGKEWQPLDLGLPLEAREITAMAADSSSLWIGTRRAGVWQYTKHIWTQHLPFDDPYNHNAQMFAVYQNRLYVSTLEDGLAVRTADGWEHETVPHLSSVAPRQLVEFQGTLYVRHGNGKVDKFDNGVWTQDICAILPRKQTSMIAADSTHLYVGQWGGWSEFDGKKWAHHFELKELQKSPMTALYPQGDTLWIGTQNRGLAEYTHSTGRLRWHDERQGFRDDWVTAIIGSGKSLSIGTFVGGMMQWDGRRWTPPVLPGENVTAFAPDSTGGLWIGTRTGLWHRTAAGQLTPPKVPNLDTEIQALLAVNGGLWVGTRTELFFLR